jgi:hypothetical protein
MALDDLTMKWEKLQTACWSGLVIQVSDIVPHKIFRYVYKPLKKIEW